MVTRKFNLVNVSLAIAALAFWLALEVNAQDVEMCEIMPDGSTRCCELQADGTERCTSSISSTPSATLTILPYHTPTPVGYRVLLPIGMRP